MKKSFISTRLLTEIALVSAIAFALDFFQGGLCRGIFPNGGSIGLAMLPIFILTFRRGLGAGLIAGGILAFLQMLGGVFAVPSSWYMVVLQILLDYVLAYPLLALGAGLFAKKFKNTESHKKQVTVLTWGVIVGGLFKFLSHFIAGVVFWGSNAPEGFPGGEFVYSLAYNGAYMLPNIIINLLIILLIFAKQPKILIPENKEEKVNA